MPLDPWIIEEIKKREEEKRRREEQQPTVPADDPREMPELPTDRQPGPGYEMPNPADPKRDQAEKKEESGRGVFQIDIGGDDDENTIDIGKIPRSEEGDEDEEKRPD